MKMVTVDVCLVFVLFLEIVSIQCHQRVNFTTLGRFSDNPSSGALPILVFDCNNDGFLDVIRGAATNAPKYLSVNYGNGTFEQYRLANGIRGMGWGDWNNDGKVDFVERQGNRVWTNLGWPNCTGWSTSNAGTNNGEAAFFVDVNGDGFLDVVSPAGDTGTSWYQNNLYDVNRTIMWDVHTYFPGSTTKMGGNTEGTTACDINMDYILDFICVDGNGGGPARVWTSTTNTTTLPVANFSYTYDDDSDADFGLPFPSNHESSNWVWGDCNEDGYPDVYLSGTRMEGLYIFDPQTGKFYSTSLIPLADPIGADWGDVDQDGHIDLMVSTSGSILGSPVLFLNNGSCSFTAVTMSELGISPPSLGRNPVFADIDNDGDLDIVSAYGRIALNDLNSPNITNSPNFFFVTPQGIGQFGGAPVTPFGAIIKVCNSRDPSNSSFQMERRFHASYNSAQQPWPIHFGGLDPSLRYDIRVTFPSLSFRETVEAKCLPLNAKIEKDAIFPLANGGRNVLSQHILVDETDFQNAISFQCSGVPILASSIHQFAVYEGEVIPLNFLNITVEHTNMLPTEQLRLTINTTFGRVRILPDTFRRTIEMTSSLDGLQSSILQLEYRSGISPVSDVISLSLDDSPLGQLGVLSESLILDATVLVPTTTTSTSTTITTTTTSLSSTTSTISSTTTTSITLLTSLSSFLSTISSNRSDNITPDKSILLWILIPIIAGVCLLLLVGVVLVILLKRKSKGDDETDVPMKSPFEGMDTMKKQSQPPQQESEKGEESEPSFYGKVAAAEPKKSKRDTEVMTYGNVGDVQYEISDSESDNEEVVYATFQSFKDH